MQLFFHLLAFAGFTYAWAYYMFNRDYEFALLSNKYVGFGDQLGNSITTKSGNRIKWNLGWILLGFMTLVFLMLSLYLISELVKLLPDPVLLWVLPITSGFIIFFRDLVPLKKLKDHKGVFVLRVVLVLALVSGWYLYPTWWTYNVVAFVIGLKVIRALSPMRLKYLLGFMMAVVVYDIWGVFYSERIVEVVSTTIEVSKYIPPAVVLTPNSSRILGIADLIFPGLVMVSVFKYGLATAAFAGFAVGLGLLVYTLFATGNPLPAMLYLGPATFIGLLIGALYKGVGLKW